MPSKKEELQKRFSEEFDTQDIIKRLRQEKLDWEKNFYKTGKNQGEKWARSAHYEDLLYVLHYDHTYQLIHHENYKSYFTDLYEAHDLGKYSGKGDQGHEKKFLDGWFDGVNLFWNEIREQI
jgi:hypothetical protein